MNIQVKNMIKEANKGSNWLVIAAENNTSMLYNSVKAEGWTPANMTSEAVVEAIGKCIDFVQDEQKLSTLKRILSVPVLWQNLSDVGREMVVEMAAKTRSLEGDEGSEKRWGEGFNIPSGPSSPADAPGSDSQSSGGSGIWASVLATVLPTLVNVGINRPWMARPTQDTAPQVERHPFIIPIAAAVGFLVIGLVISAMVKNTA